MEHRSLHVRLGCKVRGLRGHAKIHEKAGQPGKHTPCPVVVAVVAVAVAVAVVVVVVQSNTYMSAFFLAFISLLSSQLTPSRHTTQQRQVAAFDGLL